MATVQSLRDQARVAIADGDYDRALSLLRSIHSQFPDDFETTGLLAQIDLENGQRSQARHGFLSVLEADPENVLARSALAMIAEEEGNLDEALEQFERAFDLNPSNQQIVGEIRRIHSRLGHTRPVDPWASQHALARRLLREKKYERALSAFHSALRLAPEAVEIGVGAAQALWFCRRAGEAEELARKIQAHHPNCLVALALLAGSAILRRDQQYNSLLDRTAALNPGNSLARGLIEGAGLPYPRIGERVEVRSEEPREAKAPARAAPGGEAGTFSPPRTGGVGVQETGTPQPEAEEPASREKAIASRLELALEEAEGPFQLPGSEPDPESDRSPEVDETHSEAGASALLPAETDLSTLRGSHPQAWQMEADPDPFSEESLPTQDLPGTPSLLEEVAGPPIPVAEGEVSLLPPETSFPTVSEAGTEAIGVEPAEGEEEAGWEEGPEPCQPVEPERELEIEVLPAGREISAEQRANAQLHVSFGRSFMARGNPEFALAEYRTALRLDPATAPAVAQAARSIAEADPANTKARWLVGDALALQGRFRQAVEQYLGGMGTPRGDSPSEDDSRQDERSTAEEQ